MIKLGVFIIMFMAFVVACGVVVIVCESEWDEDGR